VAQHAGQAAADAAAEVAPQLPAGQALRFTANQAAAAAAAAVAAAKSPAGIHSLSNRAYIPSSSTGGSGSDAQPQSPAPPLIE
jgi:hypothetical protein